MKYVLRFLVVTAGAVLMAININTFVYTGGLLPGGFSGIVLLIQETVKTYLGITIPYSLFYWLLNSVPALICFKYVGKRFTLYSIWMIIASGLLTDIIPSMAITDDTLLCSIFGGLLNGTAIILCLRSGATSGGTDFISIYVSEKTGKSAWNYIFFGNCVILTIFGLLFGWSRALYSIIFQYTSTQVVSTAHKRYHKSTLLIVSDKTDEIVRLIRDTTHHDATLFHGTGCWQGADRRMLYTVVSSDQEHKLVNDIRKLDPGAFVNVLQTKSLNGRFFMQKND